MIRKIVSVTVMMMSAKAAFAQADGKIKESNAHIGLVYPISTNGTNAINYKNKFSLHAIGGVSSGEEGFCASGMANYVNYDGNGVMAAGFANIIMDNAKGAQLAGFMNLVKHNTEGLQAAGFANISGNVRGAQLAGFINLAGENSTGLQAAGFMNLAKNIRGLQAAGFGNNAVKVKGSQVAGFYNIAENVNTQVAGFINIAKDVKGVQLSGFINIADSCDYPIGLVNISRAGEKFLGVTVDDNLNSLVTFRSGGKYLYGIVGLGANPRYSLPVYATEGGLGAHIPIAKKFRINTEVAVTSLSDFWSTVQVNSTLRVLPAAKLGKRLEIFAGPSYNYCFSNDAVFADRTNNLWTKNQWGYYQSMYIGGILGLHMDI